MLTPCVGREDALDRVRSLLLDGRWVTVTGAPGCGKTLLARHAAEEHPRAVWVSARSLRGADAIVTAALDALGADIAPGDPPFLALKRALDDQDVLLVLDGVDSVDGLGILCDELIDSTSTCRLLCTASSVAGRPHERVVRLGPLRVPQRGEGLEGPAVELFLARIAAAGGHPVDLRRDERNVRRLLQASGGLPLLIEHLGVQIALVGVSDVTPTASIDEAVHASYALLDDDQKRCFRRLAVMQHPVSLDVLADITGVTRAEAAQLASALARRSLVEVHSDGRFDMLAPIRRHGVALTVDGDDHEQAVAGLLRWAERVTPSDGMSGAADESWLREMGVMRQAITAAAAEARTRPLAYRLANNIFSSLYTAMRAREAVEILEEVLASGDGPADIGSQLARRAGICASEVRGTYEGMPLLERAEQHALTDPHPDRQRARNASIRAEMHLDAGALDAAREEVEAGLRLAVGDDYVLRQLRRTLVDIHVCRGEFDEAEALAEAVMTDAPAEEQWMALSARMLMGVIAAEQGRTIEAAAIARAARDRAVDLAEDRIALLADTLYRAVSDSPRSANVHYEWLPWGVRLGVQLQDARDLMAAQDCRRAAGLAADIIVLADSIRLGRDGIEARLLLGDALTACDEGAQAVAAYLGALRQATECGFPLRAADALDGLDRALAVEGSSAAGRCSAAARALRAPRRAVARQRPGQGVPSSVPQRSVPADWVSDGQFTDAGVAAVTTLFTSESGAGEAADSPLSLLTRTERTVASLVAQGLTNRQIAEQLFVSPRTVDAHLAHIFRKLDISSRARLAALMVDHA
ncbi:LuxR C-terminal-related transcriptional regulator [Phycicoccus sp. SLBN-51]|uniref:helix-turn-helix transcriptional regulator n=1 Tax=Phycicoccus sp. SLBN-51 TaxID=2768447 RepID=UPI0011532CA2|nr:LuxR C-terminal-related transcriptional regulator [Phycicoccus sp. SLBN-51]TQJ49085.1 regulatory LuxR family protein [Phycicoccus sp. SLBN-51]